MLASHTHFLKQKQDVLRIVQITDTHLYADPNQLMLGVNTQQTFTDVLTQALKKHPTSDALFMTGDIAQASNPNTYERFYQQMQATNKPYFCITGNHDDPAIMSQYLPHTDKHQLIETQHWYFILLNSHDTRSPAGLLNDASFLWLQNTLNHITKSNKPIMVVLHHHPLPMHSRWIDQHMLHEPKRFLTLLASYQQVKAICFGHVHQDFYAEYQDIKLFATPSTSIQFKPKSQDFQVDAVASGYRWFHFFADGTLETAVERLHYVPENLEMNSLGY